MNYSGRVTCDLSQQELIIQGLKDRCEGIIVYRHESKSPHIHILMALVKCSYDTLVNVVKRVIPGAAKTKYSFKTNADDGFIRYMSKGHLDPVYNRGFSDELVAQRKSEGYDGKHRDDTDDVKVHQVEISCLKTVKVKQKTQYEMVSEIIDIYSRDTYDYDELYDSTVQVIRANKKAADMFYVMKLMEAVCMFRFPDDHRAMVKKAWNLRHRINF